MQRHASKNQLLQQVYVDSREQVCVMIENSKSIVSHMKADSVRNKNQGWPYFYIL